MRRELQKDREVYHDRPDTPLAHHVVTVLTCTGMLLGYSKARRSHKTDNVLSVPLFRTSSYASRRRSPAEGP